MAQAPASGRPGVSGSIFGPTSFWKGVVLTVFLVCGFGTRMYDLVDPPLDYAPSRQLRSLLISRGLYLSSAENRVEWERELGQRQLQSQEMLEPRIMEGLTAVTYRVMGGIYPWAARIYAALFWTLGGLAVYALASELTSSAAGVFSLLYYLFVPFGLIASRTFQPDPLMTALIVTSWWCLLRWKKDPSTMGAILAGLVGGAAVLVKSTAAFFIFFGMAALFLNRGKLGRALRDPQTWLVGGLTILPALIYHIEGYFISGLMQGQLAGRLFNPSLWGEGRFYLDWLGTTGKVLGHEMLLILAAAGIVLLKDKKGAWFISAIWLGAVVYGFAVSYYVTTHAYYLLPLIPLTAVSLSGVFDRLIAWMDSRGLVFLIRAGAFLVLVAGVGGGYFLYHREDYRHEPGYYQKVSSFVPPGATVLGFSQDYGFRLAYYGWLQVQPWSDPEGSQSSGTELQEPPAEFGGYDYFIVTRLGPFRELSSLKSVLDQTYPVLKKGGGYLIYDLQERITP